ncbi:putative oligopeptide transporter [Melampsora americana]|nr:putative oligopeptide transporter [Melampsora americana]
MSEKNRAQDLVALDDERICDALSAKPTSKVTNNSEPVLSPLKSHIQLASKGGHNLSHLDAKLGDDYSDPFDECAVLPEAGPDEEPDAPVITFRSVLVGVIMVCFGAAISQVFMYKPVHLHLNLLFLQLASLILVKFFAAIPGPKWWNPCDISVKETVFSAIVATSGAGGVQSVEVMATLDVFFDRPIPSYVCVLTILSSQLMGYGWAGLYRSFFIHPKRIFFPSVLPSVALFHSLGKASPSNLARLSIFKKVFGIVTIYEVIPQWIAPALQAISPWCLTLPQTPAVTQIFGGSLAAEGLGLLAVSFDWVFVGRYNPLFVPLVSQITDWAAVGTGIFLFSAAYRYDWFGGAHLPFISYDILDNDGVRYNLTRALFANGTENTVEVENMGLPSYATSIVIGIAGTAFSVSSAIAAAISFNWKELSTIFSSSNPDASQEDPHRSITKHYPDFPTWGFLALGISAIGLSFYCSATAGSGLSVYALGFAFVLSAVLSFAAVFFYGTVGIPLHCQRVVQMLGGVLFPGNAIGNLWFTLYGSTSVNQCVNMSKDLKLGQYMNLPTLCVVIGQVFGTILGGLIHYGIMGAIVSTQKDVLLIPHGNGVFTGMALSGMAASATTWGIFSRRLYFIGCKYSIIPYSLILGFFAPIPLYLLHRWKPNAGFQRVNISLFASSLFHAVLGATSGRTTATILALYTQYTIRKYHFKWYQEYNYILSAALEGGAQFAVLLLTFFVQGGAGFKLKIPTFKSRKLKTNNSHIDSYFLNPKGTRDYCYLSESQ